jgi:hypothetical protein
LFLVEQAEQGRVDRDVDVILNRWIVEGGIAADEQDFGGAVLDRLIDLTPPTIPGSSVRISAKT